jgi:predicted AAA+ superfamily ATPase
MYRRNLREAVITALSDTPAVFLQGPRQAGKSTLAQKIAESDHPAQYLSLDDAAVLSAAKEDPQGFISGLSGSVVLDEVQRVPELLLAIKREIDKHREPGKFLLTGSADVLLVPKISESLSGRLEILTLWPLSQGELADHTEGFIDKIFGSSLPSIVPRREDKANLMARMLTGGYPEVSARNDRERQQAWFGSYITTILQRDIRDLASIDALADVTRLLSILAASTSHVLNFSDLSRGISVPLTTLRRYTKLLEATFLLHQLPAWFRNLGKRLVKTAKVILSDSGLAAHLIGVDNSRLLSDPHAGGQILETFATMELLKQTGWSKTKPRLFHYRTHSQREVDVVLENRAGQIVGIEIKSSTSLKSDASSGLKSLAESSGESFLRGVILYLGEQIVPFSPRIHAIPLPALWCW